MKFLIIPGYTNSGPNHWQSHLQNAYDSFFRVSHTNWNFVDRECWIKEFEETVDTINDEIIVIGHSCGSNVIAQWSQKNFPNQTKIKAAILVAPADVDRTDLLPAEISSQGPMPYNRLPFPALVIGSDNDPFMEKETLSKLSGVWGAELIIISNAGHIASDDGYGYWPDIVRYIEKFANVSLPLKK